MQKHVNLVDLVKSFPTNIYLQNLASIQPRTSLSKSGETEQILQSTPCAPQGVARFGAGEGCPPGGLAADDAAVAAAVQALGGEGRGGLGLGLRG